MPNFFNPTDFQIFIERTIRKGRSKVHVHQDGETCPVWQRSSGCRASARISLSFHCASEKMGCVRERKKSE